MNYYSAIKIMMSSAATWRDLEMIIRSEMKSERARPQGITYPEYNKNKLVYETERLTDQETNSQ